MNFESRSLLLFFLFPQIFGLAQIDTLALTVRPQKRENIFKVRKICLMLHVKTTKSMLSLISESSDMLLMVNLMSRRSNRPSRTNYISQQVTK